MERTGALQVALISGGTAFVADNDLAANTIRASVAASTYPNAVSAALYKGQVSPVHGVLSGAAGGLIGAAAMILFADGWNWLAGRRILRLGTEEEAEAAGKVVDIVTRRVLHTRLDRNKRQRAATAFHFAFGTIAGAMYGAVAESVPVVTTGMGAPFGALEWLFGNKLTAPQFGLLKTRRRYSKQERLQTLASHVVFGVVIEMIRSRLCKRFQS